MWHREIFLIKRGKKIMLKNYFKVAVRNIFRHKMYSLINVSGLTIGITCCLLILFYIFYELSYDKFHKNADRIFRINTYLKFGATELKIPVTADMMGYLLKKDYPQIEEFTRIYNFAGNKLVKKGNQYYDEQKIAYVDSTFFKVFTYSFLYGSKTKVLCEPNTVVITKSIAEKYFGSDDAVGKIIQTKDDGGTVYKITAVIQDMPDNSHFNFDFLFPMMNLHYDWGNLVSSNFHTYLLLRKGIDYKKFEKHFAEYRKRYEFPYAKKYLQIQSIEEFEKAGNKIEHSLIPVTDIHLYSKRAQEMSPSGNIEYIYILSAVALFILLIACINFMNLTTAGSANRAREVGIRKVLGTERKSIIFQFLSESILISTIAVAIAVVIAFDGLPLFNNLVHKKIDFNVLSSVPFVLFILILPILVGLIAGSYPAFYLSKFMPGEIIKGRISRGSKSGGLRSTLVIFQFTASIILIIGTIIIYKQLNYIQNKNLGYQKDQVLIINDSYMLGNNVNAFKNEMLKVPGVISGTISGFLPVPSQRNFSAFYTGAASVSESGLTMQRWKIDDNYLKTLGIKLIEGRNFSPEFGGDSASVILNETAVKQLDYINPVGKILNTWVNGGRIKKYSIIGVVKDFNFESLHQDIGPLCFVLERSTRLISFKVSAAQIPFILGQAEHKWKSMASGMPFGYRFMDDSFNEVYKNEKQIGLIALSFSVLAILIACLGLFGLATFLIEQKTKEIGIRKVLGASMLSLLFMLSKEFLKWILIANVIAVPVAFYFMNNWLKDFAYRINISWWVFVFAGAIALMIALATVSFKAIRAANANPVKSLRYE